MKEKKNSLPQQICHRKRNDWNFCPGIFRKICLKATTRGQNVMFDVSFSFKTSKVWLCFACCLPFKKMCFHNPAQGVLLIKKCRWKNIVVCPCNFFPCGIYHNWKDRGSPCSGLLLTRFANEKNEFLAQEISMANLPLNKKCVLEICPSIAPRKFENETIFHFMLNFYLKKYQPNSYQ